MHSRLPLTHATQDASVPLPRAPPCVRPDVRPPGLAVCVPPQAGGRRAAAAGRRLRASAPHSWAPSRGGCVGCLAGCLGGPPRDVGTRPGWRSPAPPSLTLRNARSLRRSPSPQARVAHGAPLSPPAVLRLCPDTDAAALVAACLPAFRQARAIVGLDRPDWLQARLGCGGRGGAYRAPGCTRSPRRAAARPKAGRNHGLRRNKVVAEAGRRAGAQLSLDRCRLTAPPRPPLAARRARCGPAAWRPPSYPLRPATRCGAPSSATLPGSCCRGCRQRA
jgi:hypothetical protein